MMDDGFPLVVHTWGKGPANPYLRGIIVLVHGMSEHALRYETLANALVERGFFVYAPDLRGHGRNITATTPIGHIANKDSVGRAAKDISAVIQLARTFGLPVGLCGHSFGTTVARKLLVDDPKTARDLFAVALSSTSPRIGPAYRPFAKLAQIEAKIRGAATPDVVVEPLIFGGFNLPFERRTNHDWLSNNAKIVDSYVADPLCGAPCSTSFWRDLLETLPQIQAAEDIGHIPVHIPMLLLAGTLDPMSAGGIANGFLAGTYSKVGTSVKDERIPLGRHEVLNLPNVAAQTASWFVAHAQTSQTRYIDPTEPQNT
jgi:alpha-beta hydrolase superfamily lysophospholipase